MTTRYHRHRQAIEWASATFASDGSVTLHGTKGERAYYATQILAEEALAVRGMSLAKDFAGAPNRGIPGSS